MGPFRTTTLCIIGLVLSSIVSGCSRAPQPVELPAPDVTVAHPVKQDVIKYLEYTGSTSALESVDLRARVQGFLESVNFEPSSLVKKDDLLFVIDPKPYKAKVEQAQATLEARKASLGLAQVEEDKAKQLESKEAISQLKYLEAKAKRDVAKANVAKAQADLDAAQLDLDYTQVKSPIAGRVGRNLVDVGNLVGATEKTLLTIVVNDSSVYVYFNVSELDLLPLIRKHRVEAKSPSEREEKVLAFIGLADEKGYPHEGILDFADTKVDSSTGTMRVRAVVKNPTGILLPGLFVRVRVPIDKNPALLVPDVAIMADQGGRYVMVVDDKDVAEQRRVTTGQLVDRMRVVAQGLKETDRVIVNGIQRVRPGAKVNITQSEGNPAKKTGKTEKDSTQK